MKKVIESYYTNGQLATRINYLNDKLHGLSEWWWSNGVQWEKDYHLI